MGSCIMFPTVRSKKSGLEKSSPLFNSLLEYTVDRNKAVELYEKYLSPTVQRLYSEEERDEYGEISIMDFIKKTSLLNELSPVKFLNGMLKTLGKGYSLPESLKLGEVSMSTVARAVLDFNKSRYGKELNLEVTIKDGNYILSFTKDNNPSIKERRGLEGALSLLAKLEEVTTSKGFSTSYIDHIESSIAASGKITFNAVKNEADTLIGTIELSKDATISDALEEQIHAIIALMGGHPLLDRLREYLKRGVFKEVLGEEYERYNEAYEGNISDLVEEALGKLLKNIVLEKTGIVAGTSFLQDAFDKISVLSTEEIQEAISLAQNIANLLTSTKREEELYQVLKNENLANLRALYSLKTEAEAFEKLLNSTIEASNKKMHMAREGNLFKVKDSNGRYKKEEQGLKSLIQQKLQGTDVSKKAILISYIADSSDSISKALQALYGIMSSGASKAKQAELILKVKMLLDSSKALEEYLAEYATVQGADDRLVSLYEGIRNTNDITSRHIEGLILKINHSILSEYTEDADKLLVASGEYKTLEELLVKSPYEVGSSEMYLRSLAQSSDPVLRIIDRMSRTYSKQAYLKALEQKRKILALAEEYKKKGITDYKFMRSKDEEGNRTFDYIYITDESKYRDYLYRRTVIMKEEGLTHEQFMDKYIGTIENPSPFIRNKQWDKLTPIQQEFMKKFLSLKAEIDLLLPRDKVLGASQGIAVRKDKMERLKTQGILGLTKAFGDDVSFVSSDEDLANFNNVAVGFDGRRILGVPIYYHRLIEGETMEDISEDEISNLIAYSAMGYNYANMKEASYMVELQMYSIRNRKTLDNSFGKKSMEAIKSTYSRLGLEDIISVTESYAESNNAYEMLKTFVDRVYYGINGSNAIIRLNEKEISLRKATRALGALDGFTRMSLNFLGSIVNYINGEIPIVMEAISGSIIGNGSTPFNFRQYTKAHYEYTRLSGASIAALNNPVKHDKLSLLTQLFDIGQKEKGYFNDTDYIKSFFEKANARTLSFMQTAGEHSLAHRVAIAMLMNTPMVNSKTKQATNLYDALEVVPIDKKNPSLGSKLVIKEGIVKPDGTEFSLEVDSKDLFKTSEKINETNRYLQGIYNSFDSNKLRSTALGGLVMMYRNWIVPMFNRKFGEEIYNENLGTTIEGNYRTLGKFLVNVASDIRKMQFSEAFSRFSQLEDSKKANIVKAILEMALLALMVAFTSLMWDDDEDKKKGNKERYKGRVWASLAFEYVMRRVIMDLQFHVPNTNIYSAVEKTISTPAVALGSIDQLLKIFTVFHHVSTGEAFDEVERGGYKGEMVIIKDLSKIPVFNLIDRIRNDIHPEKRIDYTKNPSV